MEQLSWPRVLRVLALTAVDLSAVAVLASLFSDGSAWPLLAAIVVVVHLVGAVLRGLRAPTPVATMAGLVLTTVMIGRELFPTTLRGGLVPTGATAELARAAVLQARATYGTVVAPVAPLPGFVLLAAAAAWIVASTSDLVAFPGGARLEALVPGTAMILFSSVLGPDERSLGPLVLFAGAAAVAVAGGRIEELRAESWLGPPDRSAEIRTALAGAAALGLAVTAVGVGTSAAVGRVDQGALDWRTGRNEAAARQRADANPMVTVRSRLVDQSDRPLFRAETVVGGARFDLWRQRTLERFDGTYWSAATRPEPAATRGGPQSPEVRITVEGLRGSSLPVPGYVVAVRDGDGYDTNLAGVDLRSDDAVAANGLRSDESWRIRWVPRPTLEDLGRSRRPDLFTLDGAELVRLTTVPLPDADRAALAAIARQVTGDVRDPVEQARLLRVWFLGAFTYDLDVARGDGATSVVEFVTRTRRGYCEQFASAYASMARLLGIPARVVVGFARGVPGADGSETVQGRHAHAWVEVFAPGTPGWVTVDPTPGQGLNATGRRPSDEPVGPVPTTVPNAAGLPTTVAPPTTEPAATPDDPTGRALPSPSGTVLVVIGGVALWLAAAAASRTLRSALRGPAGPGPDQALERAWLRAEDALAWAGDPPRPNDSPLTWAMRCRRDGRVTGPDAQALVEAAVMVTALRFGPAGPGAASSRETPDARGGATAERMAALTGRVTAGLGPLTRVRRAFSPRLRPPEGSAVAPGPQRGRRDGRDEVADQGPETEGGDEQHRRSEQRHQGMHGEPDTEGHDRSEHDEHGAEEGPAQVTRPR